RYCYVAVLLFLPLVTARSASTTTPTATGIIVGTTATTNSSKSSCRSAGKCKSFGTATSATKALVSTAMIAASVSSLTTTVAASRVLVILAAAAWRFHGLNHSVHYHFGLGYDSCHFWLSNNSGHFVNHRCRFTILA